MATALPAALGLKQSHFAGSGTARTGGGKIGTARKIHLVEASTQQNSGGGGRAKGGAARRNLHPLCGPSPMLIPATSALQAEVP